MVTRYVGSGRAKEGGFLALHKQDFEAHITGGDWRHESAQIDVNPQLSNAPGSTVRAALSNLGTSVAGKIVAVGDGTNSFGDYSGTDAIQQAIAAVTTGATDPWTLLVYVKHGEYVLTSANGIDIPELGTLILIGESGTSNDATVSSVIRDDRSDLVNGAISINGNLYCDKIYFKKGSGLGYAIHVARNPTLAAYASMVEVENCTFVQTVIRAVSTVDGTKLRFFNCNFRGDVSSPDYSFCKFEPNRIGSHGGVEFDTCDFTLTDGCTAVTVAPQSITYSSSVVLRYVRFRNCYINIGAISTDPLHNSKTLGPIAVRNQAALSLGDFYIDEITFDDCRVYAGTASSYRSMLLYLYVKEDQIYVNNLNIRGGRWMTQHNSASITTPIYIGGSGPTSVNTSIERVCIENVEMGWGDGNKWNSSGRDYGAAPAEVTGIAKANWAAFFIHARHIYIRNWQIRGTTRFGTESAELALQPRHSANVDGIYINDFLSSGTVTSLPNYRIKLETADLISGDPEHTVYRNVVFNMGSHTGSDIDLGRIILVTGSRQVLLDSCHVLNTRIAGGGVNGGQGFYVGSEGIVMNYVFRNCVSRHNKVGLAHIYDVASSSDVGIVTIEGGYYEDNYAYGIAAITNGKFDDDSFFKIVGATVRNNGNAAGNPGIYLRAGSYTLVGKGWTVLNNTVTDNHSAANNAQITIGDTSVNSTSALIAGNNCHGNNATAGKIRVLTTGAGSYYLRGFGVYNLPPGSGGEPPFFDFPVTWAAVTSGGDVINNVAQWQKV